MFLFRFLAGMSAAFTAPQVWAAIATLVPPDKMVKAMGVATAGLAASQALGVPIGSYLAAAHWPTPFFVIGCGAIILVILILVLIPHSPPALQNRKPAIFKRYRTLVADGRAKKAFLAYFVFQTGNFAAFSFIGPWLSDKYELSSAGIGTVMIFPGLGNTVGSFYGGTFTQKIGHWRALTVGILLSQLYTYLFP